MNLWTAASLTPFTTAALSFQKPCQTGKIRNNATKDPASPWPCTPSRTRKYKQYSNSYF